MHATSRDLERSDALLDLIGGWFVLAEEAYAAIQRLARTAVLDVAYRPAVDGAPRAMVSVDLDAWQAIAELANRPAPVAPIAPIREEESRSDQHGN